MPGKASVSFAVRPSEYEKKSGDSWNSRSGWHPRESQDLAAKALANHGSRDPTLPRPLPGMDSIKWPSQKELLLATHKDESAIRLLPQWVQNNLGTHPSHKHRGSISLGAPFTPVQAQATPVDSRAAPVQAPPPEASHSSAFQDRMLDDIEAGAEPAAMDQSSKFGWISVPHPPDSRSSFYSQSSSQGAQTSTAATSRTIASVDQRFRSSSAASSSNDFEDALLDDIAAGTKQPTVAPLARPLRADSAAAISATRFPHHTVQDVNIAPPEASAPPTFAEATSASGPRPSTPPQDILEERFQRWKMTRAVHPPGGQVRKHEGPAAAHRL